MIDFMVVTHGGDKEPLVMSFWDDDQTGGPVVLLLLKAFKVMACTNVVAVEEKPPAKLNKKRLRRQRTPEDSTWTLRITNSRKKYPLDDEERGTHASPRLHFRRGHMRQYAPEKYTWVTPCMVGIALDGVINKDYEVSLQ